MDAAAPHLLKLALQVCGDLHLARLDARFVDGIGREPASGRPAEKTHGALNLEVERQLRGAQRSHLERHVVAMQIDQTGSGANVGAICDLAKTFPVPMLGKGREAAPFHFERVSGPAEELLVPSLSFQGTDRVKPRNEH